MLKAKKKNRHRNLLHTRLSHSQSSSTSLVTSVSKEIELMQTLCPEMHKDSPVCALFAFEQPISAHTLDLHSMHAGTLSAYRSEQRTNPKGDNVLIVCKSECHPLMSYP